MIPLIFSRFLKSLAVASVCLSVMAPAFADSSKLPAVTLDGTYFVRNQKRFIPVGAHWVPAVAGVQWNEHWDPISIEADFAKMHELGYTLTRLDLMWGWFEPMPGVYREEAFQHLDYLITLAHKYQIYLHPSLFIGGEVGEAWWDVPWREGRNPYCDDMERAEYDHAAQLSRRYANETAIIAWDLTDEPPFWIVAGHVGDSTAIDWTRLVSSAIRGDARHPNDVNHPIVVGTAGAEVSHGPYRSDNLAETVDFFSVHPFSLYEPDLYQDPMLSVRGTYAAAFEITLSSGAGRPAMIHEMGASTAQYAPERVAQYDRTNMYSGLAAGSIGIDLWTFTDASPAQRNRVPYLRTPQETEWGMTTWEGKDKPLATEFKKLSALVGQLDLTDLRTATANAAVIIPTEWSMPAGDFSHSGLGAGDITTTPYASVQDGQSVAGISGPMPDSTWLIGSALTSFILSSRAGLKVDFPREFTDEWKRRPLVLLPSPLTSTGDNFSVHVHTDFYSKAKEYVKNGGVLYASVAADAAIPEMDALFGAHLLDSNPVSEVTLKFVTSFGLFKKGDEVQFSLPGSGQTQWGSLLEVSTGQIIAVDQNGNPALVAHVLGKGKTLVSAYPLETYLATTPSAFEHSPPWTDRLYASLRDWAHVSREFLVDNAAIEVSSLVSTRKDANMGYTFIINHSAKTESVQLSTSRLLHSVAQITPLGSVTKHVTRDPKSGRMVTDAIEVGAWDAAVIRWK